jgi:hypothetical protein
MRIGIAAALALTAASSLDAQTAAPPAAAPALDLSTASAMDGSWVYAPQPGGSSATFVNAANQPQLVMTCARASRQVTVSRPASGAAPFILVWTSSETRNLPSSWNPATGRLTASVSAYDRLLDAMAFSRGRIGFSALGLPVLVVPTWAEVGRVVEDCRA